MFNEYPLISVIIPVYKVEPYLDACVSSVVNQSYRNLEIILVDDGSPDACPAMCDAWADRDSRISVIHKENGGLSDARNAGLAAMSGDYISFVDSDDWLGQDFYRSLMESMEEADAQIAVSRIVRVQDGPDRKEDRDYEQCDSSGEDQLSDTTERAAGQDINPAGSQIRDDVQLKEAAAVPKHTVHTPEEIFSSYITGTGFGCEAWNKIYHRSCYADIRFPVGRLNEDEFTTYKVLDRAARIVYCGEAAYYYRQREGSIMSSRLSIDNFDFLDAYLERLEYFKERYPAIYRQDKAIFCVTCTTRYRMALASGADQEILDRMVDYRKKVKFTRAEIAGCSRKDKIYVIGSGRNLDRFAKLLNRRCIPGQE